VKFSNLSIGIRLQGILLIALLGMLAIGGASLLQLRHSLTEDRMAKTQHVVEVAHGVLQHFLSREGDGAMTRTEAQAAALAQIKSLRYGEDEYFWVDPLVETAHLLSDALQAEQAEVAHFQEATHWLECQMHKLLRACEGYLSACQTIDTIGLRQEAERSAAIACPHATRSPSSST
jgi:hypothetical protein